MVMGVQVTRTGLYSQEDDLACMAEFNSDDVQKPEWTSKIDEPILAGRLKWRPTFEPKMVMKEIENCLLHNLESQLWAIGCVEIFSSIWEAY
jgi:hypothetical protein